MKLLWWPAVSRGCAYGFCLAQARRWVLPIGENYWQIHSVTWYGLGGFWVGKGTKQGKWIIYIYNTYAKKNIYSSINDFHDSTPRMVFPSHSLLPLHRARFFDYPGTTVFFLDQSESWNDYEVKAESDWAGLHLCGWSKFNHITAACII